MRFILLPLTDEKAWRRLPTAKQNEWVAAFYAYTKALETEGVLVGNFRPQPSSKARTVRVTDGQTEVRDGPHIDSKEQLSGVYVIDVPDLDAALSWAERNPAANFGVVEVRPM